MKYFIYAIRKDDGDKTDPDAAIDRYYYHWRADDGSTGKTWRDRQDMVNRIKEGSQAYTYRNGEVGARCEVKKSVFGTEFLKTVPNGDPTDNLSNLPEIK